MGRELVGKVHGESNGKIEEKKRIITVIINKRHKKIQCAKIIYLPMFFS